MDKAKETQTHKSPTKAPATVRGRRRVLSTGLPKR